jgi:triosephosphate isomerase
MADSKSQGPLGDDRLSKTTARTDRDTADSERTEKDGTALTLAECRARGDTDQVVARKVQAALAAKLQPIICVGESARDKDGNYITVVRSQVSAALKDVPTTKLKDITIAYEPVYAIGAAQPPHDHDIHEMMIVIKKELVRLYGDAASKISCIYGGAVFAHTARAILAIPDVSGFIVGRASLNPEEVSDILKSF